MSAIRALPGPQEAFLSSPADIAIYGGAAGGGKSFALLLEPLRHIARKGFGAVIFRRNAKQVRNEGGLWDEAATLYAALGGRPRESQLEWIFPAGTRIGFAHLEHERSKYDWQGAQVPLIGFDELTHFSESQFFYMLSRNRSTCGVRPYVRATCNPDADSWVARLIDWWIDQRSGRPIAERAGRLRWLIRSGRDLIFDDDRERLKAAHADSQPKSLTFIPASVHDNPVLLAADPGYLANLNALDLVERERLLGGNWKVRPAGGHYFRRGYFPIVDAAPAEARRCRHWDLAATLASEGRDPDWTVGCRMARSADGRFFVEHIERFRGTPGQVEQAIRNTAQADGPAVTVSLPQDPGQAGKAQARAFARLLAGHVLRIAPEQGTKLARAAPFSAQCEAGNVALVRGTWNEALLTELESFPLGHDDQVDAAAGAFATLVDATQAAQGPIVGLY
ncbi:phage terminase large subunit [Oceanibacterium hippocampi]|uniref:Terminase-like family protein n=1 Tax=Oceanibacterium hippocampi TaxID=745714 RepID=A0A1Y5S443_9PROT|nr:phage terminase large subunit [Oceanibacterium hippocampi]SLN31927.1 Terminase-like family protein [Oceanibacterium hippocampi]